MYVDYGYYADQYGGGITEKEFPSAERKAEAYIRKLTYAVADVYASCEKKRETGTVKSENNDGYSVSYAVEQMDGQTIEELIGKKAYKAASTYLLPTGWLSRKVGCCCVNECNDNYL